jgi:hypothetical protein
VVKAYSERVEQALERFTSPVFFSTLPDGRVVEGLAGVPSGDGPVLLVGNHQLFGQEDDDDGD